MVFAPGPYLPPWLGRQILPLQRALAILLDRIRTTVAEVVGDAVAQATGGAIHRWVSPPRHQPGAWDPELGSGPRYEHDTHGGLLFGDPSTAGWQAEDEHEFDLAEDDIELPPDADQLDGTEPEQLADRHPTKSRGLRAALAWVRGHVRRAWSPRGWIVSAVTGVGAYLLGPVGALIVLGAAVGLL